MMPKMNSNNKANVSFHTDWADPFPPLRFSRRISFPNASGWFIVRLLCPFGREENSVGGPLYVAVFAVFCVEGFVFIFSQLDNFPSTRQ